MSRWLSRPKGRPLRWEISARPLARRSSSTRLAWLGRTGGLDHKYRGRVPSVGLPERHLELETLISTSLNLVVAVA